MHASCARPVECRLRRQNHPTGRAVPAASTAERVSLIDIGINLAHASFAADREAVIARAQAAGGGQKIVTGSSAESRRAAVALARAHPRRLFATAGLHPHHAQEWSAQVAAEFCALASC